MNAYGKVSYSSRRVNAYFGALWTPTTAEGTLPAYTGLGPNIISSSLAANQPNLTRGFDIQQRNFTGNVDINVSNSSFVTVQAGMFYDDYKDTGVPSTTPFRYETSAVGLAGVPANLQGAIGFSNTPAVQIVDHDTTKQSYVQASYSAAFNAGGFHTLKVGTGVRHNANDVDQLYPGGRVLVFWDSTFTSSVPGVGSGRGTYGYTPSITSGPLARRRQTSPPCTRRISGPLATSR